MTLTFWSLYLPALAILLGLGILAGIVEAHVRSAVRRWRCQREMRKHQSAMQTLAKLAPKSWPQGTLYGHRQTGAGSSETYMSLTRDQLDGLATARDKAERKIQ